MNFLNIKGFKPSHRSGKDSLPPSLASRLKELGQQLRYAREKKGWTPELASKKSKMKTRQILALEAGDWSLFAGPAYVRGFIRLYVRTLGLHEHQYLSQLDQAFDDESEEKLVKVSTVEYVPEKAKEEMPERASHFGFRLVLLCALLLISLAFIIIFQSWKAGVIVAKDESAELAPAHVETTEEIDELASAPTAPAVNLEEVEAALPQEKVVRAVPVNKKALPVALPAEPAAAVPVEETSLVEEEQRIYRLTLFAHEPSYIRVESTASNGEKARFTGILNPDESHSFESVQFDILIGVPIAVDIIVDGQNWGPYSQGTVPVFFSIPAHNEERE